MTPKSLSLLRSGICLLALFVSALTLSFAQPLTTVPSDSNFKAHPEWNQDCVNNLAAMQGPRCDLIFIGDSITGMWGSRGKEVWEKYYSKRHALNFGAGGDGTQNALYRLETWKVKAFKPKVAVILIGTNNIGDPVEDIALGVKAVISKTQQLYPAARIILVSILPRAEQAAKVEQVNALIRAFADGKAVHYLDVASKMMPEGDSWKGLGPDRLHISIEGYTLWAETMEPLLGMLLGES